MKDQCSYTLRDLTVYFLKLGSYGFGGPVALVGYMHRDLVEKKKWLTEEEYREGLALAQLAPGPLAAQLGIYIGYVHYGILGATLTGLAFVMPSFIMVVLLGIAYQNYGGILIVRDIFYGVGAAVIGIMAVSAYKLTVKSAGKPGLSALRADWLRWLIFGAALFITVKTQREEALLFIVAGLIYMWYKAPLRTSKEGKGLSSLLLLSLQGTVKFSGHALTEIGFFFLKAGAFVFGSGLAIIPFLHAGVVDEYGWLTEVQFLDAVAVAMITPGPVVITVGFIGYLVAGFPGAAVAALATFIPCYLFTVILAPYFRKIAGNRYVRDFVDGITSAVIGALAGAVIVIAMRTLNDYISVLLAAASVLTLIYVKKLQEPLLILIAAILGIMIKKLLL